MGVMARVGKRKWRGSHHVEDGESYYAKSVERETCCDCGLSHEVRYRIEYRSGHVIRGARLKITPKRLRGVTSAVRRGFKFEKDGNE